MLDGEVAGVDRSAVAEPLLSDGRTALELPRAGATAVPWKRSQVRPRGLRGEACLGRVRAFSWSPSEVSGRRAHAKAIRPSTPRVGSFKGHFLAENLGCILEPASRRGLRRPRQQPLRVHLITEPAEPATLQSTRMREHDAKESS